MTWPDPTAVPWLVPVAVAVSVVTLLIAALGLPRVLSDLPADWFLHPRPARSGPGWLARNVVGWLLILAGVAMLFLPGQGLLAMFAGVVLADVPGKRRVALWLLRRPGVHKGVDWLRQRRGRPPLRVPGDEPPDELDGRVEEDG